MQVTEIPVINNAINNNKALLPGMIAYACAETVTQLRIWQLTL